MFRIQSRRSGGPLSAAALLVVLAAIGGALSVERLLPAGAAEGRLPDQWQRGANLTAFLPRAYAQAASRRAMLTARAAGTELVSFTPTSYMASVDSSEIVASPAKTPRDDGVLLAAQTARRLGLEVAIKPHVDVLDGTFRGAIAPADREAWFADYGKLVDRYAQLAERARADTFVIGTELTSMSADEDAWRELIDRARQRFSGRITFAANWVAGAEQITFWDALDAIGIDAYMPLGEDPGKPSVASLLDAWDPYVQRIDGLHERWDLPVLFTELGYESRLGTAARIGEGTAPLSEEAQADAYRAAFEALSPLPYFEGIWWWEWSAEGLGIGEGDGGFSPEGKEASDVLREWQS